MSDIMFHEEKISQFNAFYLRKIVIIIREDDSEERKLIIDATLQKIDQIIIELLNSSSSENRSFNKISCQLSSTNIVKFYC
jgi:hypothetical protein